MISRRSKLAAEVVERFSRFFPGQGLRVFPDVDPALLPVSGVGYQFAHGGRGGRNTLRRHGRAQIKARDVVCDGVSFGTQHWKSRPEVIQNPRPERVSGFDVVKVS
jgi:hypothetical protein